MALSAITRTTQALRIFQKTKFSNNFLTETFAKKVKVSIFINKLCCKDFCTSRKKQEDPNKVPERNAPLKPKVHKPLTSPQISLITPENEVTSTTLEQAEKMAIRRKLKLIKIVDFDTKTNRPVYKIMSNLEYFEAESENKEKRKREKQSLIKEDKLFIMSSKITENDLQFKIRQMTKLLQKKHPIRVYISQDGNPTKTVKYHHYFFLKLWILYVGIFF